jgi:hypothetical protein
MSTEFFERCPYICLRVWAWFAMFACIYFNILFEESKFFKQEVISVRSVQAVSAAVTAAALRAVSARPVSAWAVSVWGGHILP